MNHNNVTTTCKKRVLILHNLNHFHDSSYSDLINIVVTVVVIYLIIFRVNYFIEKGMKTSFHPFCDSAFTLSI